MMNKKVYMGLSKIAIATIIVTSLGEVVHAKDGDIYKLPVAPSTSVTNEGGIGNIVLNKSSLLDLVVNMSNYGYEAGGKIYKASDANAQWNANPTASAATIYSAIEANATPTSYTPQTTLTGNFNSAFGQSYVTITLPAGVAVTSITSDGTKVPSTNYSLSGTTLTILNATSSNVIKVTTSDGTVYTVINNSSIGTTNPTSPTISTIGNIIVTVNQNDSYSLPTTVQAIMSDGSTENVSISWDKQVNTSQVGTFTFNGTVSGYSSNVALTLTISSSNNNSIVTLKDKNLEQAVRDTINKPTGDIYKSDVETITTLTAENKGIQDISGIENLTNLQTLDLGYTPYGGALPLNYNPTLNQISDISALSGLTKLQYLNLSGNQISDINALSGLTKLRYLNLFSNQISNINALSELTKLQYIDLSCNKINDISVLKELIQNPLVATNLRFLNLLDNQISDDDIQYFKNTLPNCAVNEAIAY
ncbi:leucine-rich repeat domain-containing protein [Clostridium sp. WILCCON 0269]|uniref:Leucine-rich repeat domain-containing protein n=1 Tax=Candidatus Clostridium eludens TaxID=3381663 RepID=A0ABW8SE80_9CLOT